MGVSFTKDTAVGTTMGTLGALIIAGWLANAELNKRDLAIAENAKALAENRQLAADNSKAIGRIELVLRMNQLRTEIASHESELRALRRDIQGDPDNPLMLSDEKKLEAQILEKKETLRCYKSGVRDMCEM